MKEWIMILLGLLLALFVCISPAAAQANVAIALNASRLTLASGTQYTFAADAGGASVTWQSSDESVLRVDQSGNATAVSAGEATLTASAGGSSASCRVTITASATQQGVQTAAVYSGPITVYADTNNQFAMSVAQNNLSTNTSQTAASQSASDFYLMRLFLETDGTVPDVDAYFPYAFILGPDHLYVIQFSSVADTQAAYTYLAACPYVYYVVPDQIELAIDSSVTKEAETNDFAILDETAPFTLESDLADGSAFFSLSAADGIDPAAFMIFDEDTPEGALTDDAIEESPLAFSYNSWGVVKNEGGRCQQQPAADRYDYGGNHRYGHFSARLYRQ